LVPVLEEALLIDFAEEEASDRTGPDPGQLGLPELPEQALAPEHVTLVRDPLPGIEQQRRRLHPARWPVVPRIERGDPPLGGGGAVAGEPVRSAGELQHGAALLRTFGLLEHTGRVGKPAELQKGEATPEGMLFIGQLLEAALLEQLVGIAHERK